MDERQCELCQKAAKYTCPKCGIMYCSVECFQSPGHIQCAEVFYEKCVKEELQFQRVDPQSKKQMMDILKHAQDADEITDSDDDEEEEEDLCERMENVDLNNENEIWKHLSLSEKKEFKKLISSGAITELFPEWEPWWKFSKKKLITELDEMQDATDDQKDPYPPINVDIVPLAQLTKKAPDPKISFMVINTLFSYASTARWFKGKHLEMPVEGATMLFALSAVARRNAVFKSLVEAFTAFEDDLLKCKWISENAISKNEICEDVADIVNGINGDDLHHVKCCFCDIGNLLERAVIALEDDPGIHSTRFTGPPPRRRELKLFGKKIAYYLSWSEACGTLLKESMVRAGV